MLPVIPIALLLRLPCWKSCQDAFPFPRPKQWPQTACRGARAGTAISTHAGGLRLRDRQQLGEEAETQAEPAATGRNRKEAGVVYFFSEALLGCFTEKSLGKMRVTYLRRSWKWLPGIMC